MAEVEPKEEVVEQPLSQGYREDAQDVTVQYHKPGTARPPSEKDVEAQEAIQEIEEGDIVADPGPQERVPQDVRSPALAYATRDNIVVPVGTEAPAYAEVAADALNREVDVAVNPGDRLAPVVAVPADGAYRPDREEAEVDEGDSGEILYSAEPSDPEADDEDEQESADQSEQK